MKRAAALVAIAFGLATIVAGGRVLRGADPGYVVFRPLVLFNTAMGAAYVAAGIIIWRSAGRGTYAAAAIFLVNFVVLAIVAWLSISAAPVVAAESVAAMTFRTVVWLLLYLGLAWANRTSRS
jgi:hypothetical protein